MENVMRLANFILMKNKATSKMKNKLQIKLWFGRGNALFLNLFNKIMVLAKKYNEIYKKTKRIFQ